MALIRKSEQGLLKGIIVEAEAYCGEDDPASFASKGRTKKSESLYRSPGNAFIYLTYGMYYLLNIITEKEDFPAAVLIRAVEPVEGIPLMKKRRKTEELLNLCSGPGKLCQALGIDLSLNGVPVYSPDSPLIIDKGEKKGVKLVWKPRIGIREGKERLWRVYIKESPFISFK